MLPIDLEDKNWRSQALCAQIGGDLWFPDHGKLRGVREAKEKCAECPVAKQCLEFAVNSPEIHDGIWAGKTPREIREIRKQRRLAGDAIPEDEEVRDESVYGD